MRPRRRSGSAPPAPTWDEPCEIYLYATAEDYSLATGQPPQVAGHSSFDVRRTAASSRRRIDIHCDDPNAFVGVLPHETTHVVLAGRFGDRRLPHWADEGMAVLAEPRDRIDLHLRNLPRHRRDDELFPVAELMQMDGYPDGRRIGSFYAESVSLVAFLSAEKGSKVFADFLRDGLKDGYESALKSDYGINGFDDLQERWQRYAFGGDGGLALTAALERVHFGRRRLLAVWPGPRSAPPRLGRNIPPRRPDAVQSRPGADAWPRPHQQRPPSIQKVRASYQSSGSFPGRWAM